MSHHPSSADLAAFRYAIHEPGPDHDPTLCPMDGPRTRTGWPTGGAWPHELRDGIGYRIPTDRYLSSLYGPHARREAAAMRSRAFEAARCPACGVPNIPDGPGCRCYGD